MPRKPRTPVILAIVGSTQFAQDAEATNWAANIIRAKFTELKPDEVVSGGARGIDSLGARLAECAHIPVREYLPTNKRWAPHGYMERNILVAERCTHMVCIRHYLSKTYGSGWTADYAEKLGKIVERHMWDPHGDAPWTPPPRLKREK